MVETCCDVVLSNMTKLLNTLDHFIARTIRKGRREWKHWDVRQNLVIPHSFLPFLRDTCTCARALFLHIQVSQPSLIPSPKTELGKNNLLSSVSYCFLPIIFLNNYFHQPKVKNAIKHWNEINYLFFYSHIWIYLRKILRVLNFLLNTWKYSNILP